MSNLLVHQNVATPLTRPDAQYSPQSPGEVLLQASSPIDPSTGGDLLAGRSARYLIGQRTVARVVFSLRQVLLVLLAVLCIMSFVVLGWVLIEFAKHEKDPCDVPLALYVKVWVILWLFGVWKKELHKIFLRWTPHDGAPPIRVRVLDSMHIGVVHIWVAVGIYWIVTSKECSSTAPELFTAVKWWVHLQATVLLIGSLAILASRYLITWLQNHNQFAVGVDPNVMLTRTMEEIKFSPTNPILLDEKGTIEHCSVCQEPFCPGKLIRRTPCGHIFHERCLAAWYCRKPTCPLCRADLVQQRNEGDPNYPSYGVV
mmetsp:Transcript_19634/g.27401  ORF Transcript_19634/g.27401 Transcript_19634/m.27401 type:complete len:314 (+) Transcript_19634:128-1069(+)